MIKEISDSNFEEEVLKHNGIVLVEFFATWCPHCKAFAPVLEKVSSEMNGVKFVKVDIDKNPKSVALFEVESIPTLNIFKDGFVVDRNTGFLPEATLIEYIEKNI